MLLFTSASDYSKSELLGKIKVSDHEAFQKIPNEFCANPDRTYYLRKQALDSLERMLSVAFAEGIQLKVLSATRDFFAQKSIWEAKWNGQRKVNGKDIKSLNLSDTEKAIFILHYSSMPGSSRHHWGTDIDLNNLNNSYFEETEEGVKVYDWLVHHAESFGFMQPYTSKASGRTGYNEEKWHWSFYPLSEPMLKAYNEQISYEDIDGFDGSAQAKEVKIIEQYVNGISTCNPPQ